ncbi:proteophosphoglycan ppg4 [Malassezia pachydermatis]|uniref:Proteophosphoglycan ppg4 n=1 Tax=Malassezia pachydermatis TaxID=77020 RepID=A0A0M8MMJ4_9BASI|nr:proteophosphoglycan ppg4 [Malassezia pachydermatis]KOS15506.1 proteophosphoglycan ppg4 [Malassezia pachydermatis]
MSSLSALESETRTHAWLGIEKHPALAEVQQAEQAKEVKDFAKATQTSASEEEGGDDDTSSIASSIDASITDMSTVAPTLPSIPPAPTGELTLATIMAPGLPWRRRLLLLTASLAINLGLPFINGVMLGFGEIFARAFLAPWIGLAPPLPQDPFSPSPADVPPIASIPRGGLRTWMYQRRGEPIYTKEDERKDDTASA